jgi:hypothetical protein
MNVSLDLPEELLDALVNRVAERVHAELPLDTGWLDVKAAAAHLSTSPEAIYGMVKRRQIPTHRSETGRLLFRREELDSHATAGDPS